MATLYPDLIVEVEERANPFLIIGMVIDCMEMNNVDQETHSEYIRVATAAADIPQLIELSKTYVDLRVLPNE